MATDTTIGSLFWDCNCLPLADGKSSGTPAVIKADRARQSEIDRGVASYVQRTARYKAELRRLDG